MSALSRVLSRWKGLLGLWMHEHFMGDHVHFPVPHPPFPSIYSWVYLFSCFPRVLYYLSSGVAGSSVTVGLGYRSCPPPTTTTMCKKPIQPTWLHTPQQSWIHFVPEWPCIMWLEASCLCSFFSQFLWAESRYMRAGRTHTTGAGKGLPTDVFRPAHTRPKQLYCVVLCHHIL